MSLMCEVIGQLPAGTVSMHFQPNVSERSSWTNRGTPLESVLLVPEQILRFIGNNRPNR